MQGLLHNTLIFYIKNAPKRIFLKGVMPSSSSDSTLHYGWSDLALLKRFFNLNTLLQIRYVFRNSILKFGCKRPLRTCAAKFKFSKNEFYFFKFANKPSFKFKEQSAKRKAGILFFFIFV